MPYDNAAAESFFSSLKKELTHHEQFATTDEARHSRFDYIEVFYNRQRNTKRCFFAYRLRQVSKVLLSKVGMTFPLVVCGAQRSFSVDGPTQARGQRRASRL